MGDQHQAVFLLLVNFYTSEAAAHLQSSAKKAAEVVISQLLPVFLHMLRAKHRVINTYE